MILVFDCRRAFQFLQFHTFISFLSKHWSWCTICQNLPYASLCCICPVFGVSRSQNDKGNILKHRLRWACSCCLRLRTLLRMFNSFFVLRIETTKNPKLKLCNEIHHSRWIDISVDGKNRQNVGWSDHHKRIFGSQQSHLTLQTHRHGNIFPEGCHLGSVVRSSKARSTTGTAIIN